MKKKKIIILVSAILIIGIIYVLNESKYYESYIGTIMNIDLERKQITLDCTSAIYNYELFENENSYGHKVILNGKEYATAKYKIYARNAHIRDINRKKINITDLKTGDTIYIINKKPKLVVGIGRAVEHLENVKFIKIIDKSENKY